MRKLRLLFLSPLFFPISALALELYLEDPPSTVRTDEQKDFKIRLECSSCSDSYLRAAFFKDSGDYFGLTQNQSGDFVGTSSDKSLYYLIAGDAVSTGSWSGTLRVKVDTDNKYYSGPGAYQFKVIRYTKSGSKSGETEAVSLHLEGPPLPTATPVPPTAAPTSVPVSPSSTPKPKPTSTSAPLPTATPKISPAIQQTPQKVSSESALQVLGAVAIPSATLVPDSSLVVELPAEQKPKSLLWPIIFWSAGGICILASVYLFFA
jgi:hypothetical protein